MNVMAEMEGLSVRQELYRTWISSVSAIGSVSDGGGRYLPVDTGRRSCQVGARRLEAGSPPVSLPFRFLPGVQTGKWYRPGWLACEKCGRGSEIGAWRGDRWASLCVRCADSTTRVFF